MLKNKFADAKRRNQEEMMYSGEKQMKVEILKSQNVTSSYQEGWIMFHEDAICDFARKEYIWQQKKRQRLCL